MLTSSGHDVTGWPPRGRRASQRAFPGPNAPPEWPKTSGEPFGESLIFGPKTENLKIFGISLGRHTGPLRADGVAVRRLRARHRPVRCGIRPCGIRAMFIYVPNTFQHTQEASATARERSGGAQAAPRGWIKICRSSLDIRPFKKTQAYIQDPAHVGGRLEMGRLGGGSQG